MQTAGLILADYYLLLLVSRPTNYCCCPRRPISTHLSLDPIGPQRDRNNTFILHRFAYIVVAD